MADDKDTKTDVKPGGVTQVQHDDKHDNAAKDWAANRKEWEDTHTPEMGYPVVEEVAAAGQDPDTLRRNEKHAAAAGIISADDVRDPVITNPAGDKVDEDGNNKDQDKDTKSDPAKARKAASPTRNTTPQGRAATPTEKA